MDGGKIAKFVKVFSLESFPLYGRSIGLWDGCMTIILLMYPKSRMLQSKPVG